MTFKMYRGRFAVAKTNAQLTDEQVIETLNRQASRVRELETWFRLLAGMEPTYENFMALKPKPGCDAVGRRLRPKQMAAAFPQISGMITLVQPDLVQIITETGEIHNVSTRKVLVIDDPDSI